jgi:hypothetical protein
MLLATWIVGAMPKKKTFTSLRAPYIFTWKGVRKVRENYIVQVRAFLGLQI